MWMNDSDVIQRQIGDAVTAYLSTVSPTSATAIARPMPWLAPVTSATSPTRNSVKVAGTRRF